MNDVLVDMRDKWPTTKNGTMFDPINIPFFFSNE